MNAIIHTPATMTSREIADLTGKEISNVHRDIRSMLVELYGKEHVDRVAPEQYRNRHSEYIRENAEAILSVIAGDDSKRNHQDQRGFSWERDARGYITSFRLDHSHTMTLVAGYNVKLRKAIIDRWQELETQASQPVNLSRMDILKLAMDSEAGRLKAEARLAHVEPMALGFERIAHSDGSLCLTDAAKTLQIQPRKFTQLLLEKGWVYRRPMGAGYLAYQPKIQSGHLEHKCTTGEKSDGSEWTSTQVRVTAKGLTTLACLINQATLPAFATVSEGPISPAR